MGDAYPIHTLGDYSKPSHEGYRNTIELYERNNVVPLRPDTIRLVQNGCSFHRLWSEDPNQHLKDFLKLMDSIDLNGDNRERMRLRLTPKSPSSWHRSLAPSPNFYDYFNPVTRQTIDQLAGGKLRDRNTEEFWELLEDLALYDNKSWNDPRDFAKPVKAISLPQDVLSTSDRRLIELENQVQRLMKAYIAPMQPTQLNKITSSCEICSDPYDNQYCMENPKQAFVEYASSRTDEAGGKWYTFKPEQNNVGDTYKPSWKSHPNLSEMTNEIDMVLKAITDRIAGALPSDTVKNPKLNVNSITSVLSDRSYLMEDPQCSSQIHSSINAVTICPKQPNKPQNDDVEREDREERSNPKNIDSTPPSPHDSSILFITEEVRKLDSFHESSGLVPQSFDTKIVCTKGDDEDVVFIEIIRKNDDSREE
uniref:MAK10-like protein n=1 Tax=Tanacetum cinerariifolium TaxID=118510 RepID=A0A699H4P1_TANCI|nr:MAK10-like protein [Tanacetum cinerariifolium]